MSSKFAIVFIIILYVSHCYGHPSSHIKRDSVLLLNIVKVHKLAVLKAKNQNQLITPAVNIDFPYSNYDSATKTITLLNPESEIKILKSTIAIIRLDEGIDASYGGGSSGDLWQFSKKNQIIDSLVTVDSISIWDQFYILIDNRNYVLAKNESVLYTTHKEVDTENCLLDFIIEYKISNCGYINDKLKINK